ncbi:SulP family inorganic anion transporter [Streptomyces lydicus]|uniref:SulP family inorganic anion transporter n=1 Tax=Streptomyces lydicus TaxID=47763 RepID=UPI00378C0264
MKLPRPPRVRHRPKARDLGSGVVLGLVSVPDGLASGLLAAVSPVAGLYGYLVGMLVGALSTSSVLMSVQGTGAMAVLLVNVPQVRGGPQAAAALATLAVLTGVAMFVLGLLRLGTLVRFVPNAVLAGFVNAVAVNIVLSQLAYFTGYRSASPNRIAEVVDTAMHAGSFRWQTLAVGVATLVLLVGLRRTPLGPMGMVVAVVAASALPVIAGWKGVLQVQDVATVPPHLPSFRLPSLSAVVPLLVPAVSLALVGLVQGAAISRTVPNPDGRYPDVSGDFRGQGLANVASGVLGGVPVGGSMSATSLLRTADVRSRLGNLTAVAVMAGVILFLAESAGHLAMPALAALLMSVGLRTFDTDQIRLVWHTGGAQAGVMAVTFALTLLIPLQYAVLAGLGLAVVLFVTRQSNKVTVVRWTFPQGSTRPREEDPPEVLPAHEIVVLAVYGSLFFASTQTVQAQLPDVTEESTGTTVVLRLRGKEDLGSTFIQAVTRYRRALDEAGSHLVLAGVGERVRSQLERTGALAELGPDNVVAATPVVGESVQTAIERARRLRGGSPQD